MRRHASLETSSLALSNTGKPCYFQTQFHNHFIPKTLQWNKNPFRLVLQVSIPNPNYREGIAYEI